MIRQLAAKHPWTTRYLLLVVVIFLTMLAAKGAIT